MAWDSLSTVDMEATVVGRNEPIHAAAVAGRRRQAPSTALPLRVAVAGRRAPWQATVADAVVSPRRGAPPLTLLAFAFRVTLPPGSPTATSTASYPCRRSSLHCIRDAHIRGAGARPQKTYLLQSKTHSNY